MNTIRGRSLLAVRTNSVMSLVSDVEAAAVPALCLLSGERLRTGPRLLFPRQEAALLGTSDGSAPTLVST
jgi:hypothetical protein